MTNTMSKIVTEAEKMKRDIINLIQSVTCLYDEKGRPCSHAPCRHKYSVIQLIEMHANQTKGELEAYKRGYLDAQKEALRTVRYHRERAKHWKESYQLGATQFADDMEGTLRAEIENGGPLTSQLMGNPPKEAD